MSMLGSASLARCATVLTLVSFMATSLQGCGPDINVDLSDPFDNVENYLCEKETAIAEKRCEMITTNISSRMEVKYMMARENMCMNVTIDADWLHKHGFNSSNFNASFIANVKIRFRQFCSERAEEFEKELEKERVTKVKKCVTDIKTRVGSHCEGNSSTANVVTTLSTYLSMHYNVTWLLEWEQNYHYDFSSNLKGVENAFIKAENLQDHVMKAVDFTVAIRKFCRFRTTQLRARAKLAVHGLAMKSCDFSHHVEHNASVRGSSSSSHHNSSWYGSVSVKAGAVCESEALEKEEEILLITEKKYLKKCTLKVKTAISNINCLAEGGLNYTKMRTWVHGWAMQAQGNFTWHVKHEVHAELNLIVQKTKKELEKRKAKQASLKVAREDFELLPAGLSSKVVPTNTFGSYVSIGFLLLAIAIAASVVHQRRRRTGPRTLVPDNEVTECGLLAE